MLDTAGTFVRLNVHNDVDLDYVRVHFKKSTMMLIWTIRKYSDEFRGHSHFQSACTLPVHVAYTRYNSACILWERPGFREHCALLAFTVLRERALVVGGVMK